MAPRGYRLVRWASAYRDAVRSDLISLGILLYQMARGERPIGGVSSAELASAILRDTTPLVTELRGDPPADLARLIRRCLERDPAHPSRC